MSRGWKDERGAVETTALLIILPLLFFFFLFAVQATVAARANQILKAAAQEGARAARRDGGSAAEGRARAQAVLSQLDSAVFSNLQTPQVSRGNDRTRVVTSGTVASIVPGLNVTLTQVSEGPTERFRGADE